LVLGGETLNNDSSGIYNPDSIVVQLGGNAQAEGLRTLDLSAFNGPASISLGDYGTSTLTVLAGSGVDLISISLTEFTTGSYVLNGSSQDVVYLGAAASQFQIT